MEEVGFFKTVVSSCRNSQRYKLLNDDFQGVWIRKPSSRSFFRKRL